MEDINVESLACDLERIESKFESLQNALAEKFSSIKNVLENVVDDKDNFQKISEKIEEIESHFDEVIKSESKKVSDRLRSSFNKKIKTIQNKIGEIEERIDKKTIDE